MYTNDQSYRRKIILIKKKTFKCLHKMYMKFTTEILHHFVCKIFSTCILIFIVFMSKTNVSTNQNLYFSTDKF